MPSDLIAAAREIVLGVSTLRQAQDGAAARASLLDRRAELTALGRLDRKGAIDTFDAYGYLALLRRLRANGPETVYAPDFDRTIEQPVAGSIAVGPRCRLVITEGNYLLAGAEPWPAVRAELDEVWFCDLDDDERRRRLVARHVRFGKEPDDATRWVAEVDEPNARLVRATRGRADLVVETDCS